MIESMKKYTFLVLASQYDAFIEQLREAGVVHVTLKAEGLADNEQIAQTIAQIDALRRLIAAGAPEQLLQERDNIRQQLLALTKEKERMAVWGNYSSERLEQLRQLGYSLRFFTCNRKKYQEDWGIVINEEKDTLYCVAISKDASESLPEGCNEVVLNAHSVNELKADMDALNGLLAAADGRIEAWQTAYMEQKKAELQTLQQQLDWQRVSLSGDTAADGALRLLEGFCPTLQCEELNRVLDQTGCYYEAEDPVEGDRTPVKMRNNRFARLFEPLTGMYGWPDYREFDPTPILAPFYLLFFALCIGDAAYGVLIALVGYLIHKDKLKISMFEGLGPIIMTLGLGCIVVGYLMGTCFGINLYTADWFPQSAKTIMFNNWIGDGTGKVGNYDVMMVLAIAIGVFHICLAMTVKAISYTKRYGFAKMASTWGWLLLIVGGLVSAILLGTEVLSQEAFKVVFICIAAVSALGILIFNTPGRNPLINIGSGLWDTYQMATGVLGDVLSYIRLYALGLAGGMLGAAFNDLGLMVLGDTPNVGTAIGFALIVTIGHVLNLLMACLGAFVHPLRLTFVEYFKNSGYEGTGNLYRPFKKD